MLVVKLEENQPDSPVFVCFLPFFKVPLSDKDFLSILALAQMNEAVACENTPTLWHGAKELMHRKALI